MQQRLMTSGAWRLALPQGLSGHHALFEPSLVRFSMGRADGPRLDAHDRQRLLSVLMAVDEASDADEVRDWIAGAPLPVQETLVRAYFDTLFAYLDRGDVLVN